jgi:hypothetical protein
MMLKTATARRLLAPDTGATGRGPDSEGPMGKMRKLLVIHTDPEKIGLAEFALRDSCIIPKNIQPVVSMAEAIMLVDENMPDIVLLGGRVRKGSDAYDNDGMLAYIRSRCPDAKVALWSNDLSGDECKQGAAKCYDAAMRTMDLKAVQEFVERCSA